jgi:aspartate dehydrogenase
VSKPRILLIGYGALARYVFNHLQSHSGPEVSAFLVSKRSSNDLPSNIEVVRHPDQLSFKPDIILELASHQAVRDHAPYFLEKGVDFGIVSVGALAEESVYKSLTSLARQGESRLHILSGAIGGMDALSSARIGGLDEVLYRSR